MNTNDGHILKTLVHISDLHLGEIDPRTGDAALPAGTASAFHSLPWLDGLLGHHGRALEELAELFASILTEDDSAELIITGDLTRCGGVQEIALVQQFVSATIDLHPPAGNWVGLNLGALPKTCISGNHDNWGGRNWPVGGGPLPQSSLLPSTLPYVLTQHLANGRRLLLAGIDTDADVQPCSGYRLRAVGSFQSQLVKLDQMLPQPDPTDIRVLLAHHSMSRRGFLLRMDKASTQALGAFLAVNDFAIILSGHTHEQMFKSIPVSGRGKAGSVWELTCGTTTQHDQVPYNWRTPLGYPQRTWPPNTLLVHRLRAEPGMTLWEAEALLRTNGGFKSLGPTHSASFRV